MVSLDNGNDNDRFSQRYTLAFRISIGALLALVVQAVALTAWLVQMHSDIVSIGARHDAMERRIDLIDQGGTRSMAATLQRLGQMEAGEQSIAQRITRNDNRIDELIKQVQELKFWSDHYRQQLQQQIYRGDQRQPPP